MSHQDPGLSLQSRPKTPLSVGFMVHDFPVYSETFVVESAEGLVAAGHELEILAIDGQGPAVAAWPELRARTRRSTARLSLPGRGGRAIDLARQALVLRHRPSYDILHCQFGTTGFSAMTFERLGLLRTRAMVVHLRGYDITTFVRARGEGVYAPLFERADLFIANCEHFRDHAIDLGCSPDKIEVIGSPIDTGRFSPPAGRTTAPRPHVRLVTVGRLVEKKGIADVIAALGLLRDSGRDATLDILGDGPLGRDLAAQVADLGLGASVRFHGAASGAEVIAALHAADIAVTASVTASNGDKDAAVNTAKEALATGIPVIGTFHGGIPELVIPGENGDLVPERDPAALADAIARLMDDPPLRARYGAAGRRKVVEEYDKTAILDKTLAAYHRALSRSGATP